jgi:hypothetical protein
VIDRDANVVVAVLSNKTSANVGGQALDTVLEAFLLAGGPPRSP